MEVNGGAKEAQVKQHLSCGVAARVGCCPLVGGSSYHDWYSPVSNHSWMCSEENGLQDGKR